MEIKIGNMFECPLMTKEYWAYSEYTHGYDDICNITKKECLKDTCPLIKNKKLIIQWIGE